jgi:CxxC-x17-CxxC domain-containing protein
MGRFDSDNRGGQGGFAKKSFSGSRNHGGGSFRGKGSFTPSQKFPAVCDECGDNCEVPFRPTGERPVLCSACFGRQNKEAGGSSHFSRNDRRGDRRGNDGFPATCSSCGQSCTVPFRPTPGKEIYCDGCFEQSGKKRDRVTRDNSGNNEWLKDQLSFINKKLDMVIKAMNLTEVKNKAVAPKAEIKVEVKEEVKAVTKPAKEKKVTVKKTATKAAEKKKPAAKKKK